ncbi:MAG: iron-containing alcohol dehydrogenase [Acidobacteriota bacterium]
MSTHDPFRSNLPGMPALYVPTRIYAGAGASEGLTAILRSLGRSRVLLLSGKHFSRNLAEQIQERLKSPGISCELLSGIDSEPDSDSLDRMSSEVKARCPDAMIAVGGGSVMDAGKYLAAWTANGGGCVDYEKGRSFDRPGVPLITVPTVAGSGSEVTPYSVINSSATGRKFTLRSARLWPFAAWVDAGLTAGAGANVTIPPALDAWTHCLECRLSRESTGFSDLFAGEGMALIQQWLGKTLHDGADLEGRSALSRASILGGIAISHVRTGMVHTLSVALAPHVKLAHGWLNAIILPHVLNFNKGCYGMKLRRIAADLSGQPAGDDDRAIAAIREWLDTLQVPRDLASHRPPGLSVVRDRILEDQGLPAVSMRPFTAGDVEEIVNSVLGRSR